MKLKRIYRLIAAMVVYIGAAVSTSSGQLTLDATTASLSPSASPQSFFIDLNIRNDGASSYPLASWNATLSFPTPLPTSQFTFNGVSNTAFAGTTANPSINLSFQYVSITANAFSLATVSVPAGGGTVTLARFNFTLAANSTPAFYPILLQSTQVGFYIPPATFGTSPHSVDGGSIATPEPTTGLILLAVGSILGKRQRSPRV